MDIKAVLDRFSKTKIAVIGDVILDHFIYGEVERISPEAPVPIVKVEQGKEFYELGGAANTAANIASLGGEAFLLGYTGEDYEKSILLRRLSETKIHYRLLPALKQTIIKTRVVASNQQIVRIDKEIPAEVPCEIEEKLMREIQTINPDIIIVSDYAKGFVTSGLFFMLKEYAQINRKKIIVDPRPKNKINYIGVYLVTPNLKEAIEMTGMKNIEEIGRKLQEELSTNVLLTRGKDGITLFEKEKIVNIPTAAKEVYDVMGAGDTVVAVVALSIASGLNLEQASYLANNAAGIVVGKKGTATVSKSELIGVISSEYKKIKTLEELKEIADDLRKKNKKIIWTNGCFDLLHYGHVKYLQEAKQQGDILIVGINSDESIKKLKGPDRPVNKEADRAEVLAGLESVDYVVVFYELDSIRCLELLKPEVYVKGGDYKTLDEINQTERRVVEGYGGGIYLTGQFANGISTTKIIDKMQNQKTEALKS